MTSQSASAFGASDRYVIRLRKMCDVSVSKGLRKLLEWLNPKWLPSSSFKDYLDKEKNVSMKKFKSALKPHQKNALKTDPQGNTYDVSLLYTLILWVNEGLADKEDAVWKTESLRLEYLITAVKNVRNELMHCYKPIDKNEFFERTASLRGLLKDMINSAGSFCKHISESEVKITLQELGALIDKIVYDPLDPKDLTDYKNQLLFSQHCEFVKSIGAFALRNRYGKYSSLTPASLLVKLKFPVDDVFTDMIVEGGTDKKYKVQLENLFEAQAQSSADDLILVEGEAGIGKTTLTRKLLSDWTKNISKIKHIESYDLVIHAECREHVNSFRSLLNSSMSEVSQELKAEDMLLVTVCLRTLIIVDGLDELNTDSTRLFQEILKLKQNHDITVLVTSRPEAVQKYFQYARTHQFETKHIMILGIPIEKRENFVRKYFMGIEKAGLSIQDIDGLLNYLKRTEHRLGYLWGSPYNLSILTILWVMKPDIVNNITTAPELHWEIHQLSLAKLIERLVNNEQTQHLSTSQLERKINSFVYILCRESLVALANDDITLSQQTYQRLQDTCHELDLPVEEMVGAFLKRILTNSTVRYSFPHKGLQDFLAALFIWMQLTTRLLNSDVQKVIKELSNVLSGEGVSIHACQHILKYTEAQLVKEILKEESVMPHQSNHQLITKGVDDILSQNAIPMHVRENIAKFVTNEVKSKDLRCTAHVSKNFENKYSEMITDSVLGACSTPDFRSTVGVSTSIPQSATFSLLRAPTMGRTITNIITRETSFHGLLPEISKFRNMFIGLIGIFYIDRSCTISDEVKMEVLNLLEKTGVNDKNAWLNILNSVRCDDYVANFISQQPHILEGEVLITDSTLFAYIALMKALKTPVNNTSTLKISLDIKGDLTGVDDLLKMITIHHYKVISITINNNNFVDYTRLLKSLTAPLKDSNEVNVDIQVNTQLLGINDLMFQIKRNNFVVRSLEVKDVEINDYNYSEYISMLECLPPLPKIANSVGIDICMKGDLTDPDRLIQLIIKFPFKLRSILVTNMNIENYTESMEALSESQAEELRGLNFDIDLNGKESLSKLMNMIRRHNFIVRMMNVRDFKIDDSDVDDCLSMIRSLPSLTEISNQTNTDINIKGRNTYAGVLIELLTIHHFKIKRILITGQNYETYASLFKVLQTPLRDPHNIYVDICADENLEDLKKLISQIKKRKINIATLRVKHIQVTESNINKLISTFNSLPPLSEEANETTIDIQIKKTLICADKLLQLICTCHFKLKRILITDFNYKKYTSVLKSAQHSLDSPHEVNIDIFVSVGLQSVSDLLVEIRKKKFTIGTIDLAKSEIHAGNVKLFISTLKPLKDDCKIMIDINIEGDLTEAEELLQIIIIHKVNVTRLLVTDKNLKDYTTQLKNLNVPYGTACQISLDINIKEDISGLYEFLKQATVHSLYLKTLSIYHENHSEYTLLLRSLQTPFLETQEVTVNLQVKADFLGIRDLMYEIREKDFGITSLQLGPINIRDVNIRENTAALKSFPIIKPGAYKGRSIYLCIEKETLGVEEFLTEIGRKQFPLEIYLIHNFKHPASRLSIKDAIGNLSSRCRVLRYQGGMVDGMTLPTTLERLYVSIADLGGYAALDHFLNQSHSLRVLHVCVSLGLPISSKIKPLLTKGVQEPSLYIPDVDDEDISHATALIRKFQPVNGKRYIKFHTIFFPRTSLSSMGMVHLLSDLNGTAANVVFPAHYKPTSAGGIKMLEQSSTMTIYWGSSANSNSRIDDW